MEEQKFPTEVIDLPSEGRLYPEGHPLKDGKVEVKYMTAKEEDILTSANFGDLAFDSSDPVEISLTLRYDYAILKF